MANSFEPLPWQAAVWQSLVDALAEDRVPHALLICGPHGLGKNHFALTLAARLLCSECEPASTLACGRCRGCRLLRAGAHPDFSKVVVEAGKKEIRVGQIRELIRALELTSSGGCNQVAVIEQAHLMNQSAANALLKTLEEPTGATYLLLVTESPARLPATVLSRCQRLRLGRAAEPEAVGWLKRLEGQGSTEALALAASLSRGRPLVAREILAGDYLQRRQARFEEFAELAQGRTDAVRVAALWAKEDVVEILGLVHDWVEDLLRLKVSQRSESLHNQDMARELQTIATALVPTALFALLDEIREARRLCETQVVRQLLLENLLLRWQRCAGGG